MWKTGHFLIGFLVAMSKPAMAISEVNFAENFQEFVWPYYLTHGATGSFTGQAGVQISYRSFEDPNEAGALVISPGIGEPYENYAELIYDLRESHYSIYILDHRGQGISGRLAPNPQVDNVDDFNFYVSDLATFIDQVVDAKPHRKHYLLGHSMGGGISALYLEEHPHKFDAAVLLAPMIEPLFPIHLPLDPNPLMLTAHEAYDTGTVLCDLGQCFNFAPGEKPFDPNAQFSHNGVIGSQVRWQQSQDLLIDQPELQVGGASNHWVMQAILADWKLQASESSIATPILLVQSGKDILVNNSEENLFCSAVRDCREVVFPTAHHGIPYEVDAIRDPLLADVQSYYLSH